MTISFSSLFVFQTAENVTPLLPPDRHSILKNSEKVMRRKNSWHGTARCAGVVSIIIPTLSSNCSAQAGEEEKDGDATALSDNDALDEDKIASGLLLSNAISAN